MTDEEKKEIIAALKAESTDVTSLEVISSLDGVTSLPAVQGNKLVRAPIPLLAKPATDAAETANAAAETANAAAERAESAAEIAETYIRTTDDEDKYVRGTLNTTDGTISESTQTGTIVCQQYIGIPEGTEQISVWLYSVKTLSGNAAVAFYDGQHNFLSANAVTANNVNAFELPNGARYLRCQMPAENVIEIRIAADGWTLAESFNPAKIKEDIPNEIRTFYSDDGVSIDLYHDDTSLWSDTIEAATDTSAGVMSAEDKARLDGMETGANRTVVVQGHGDNAASVMSQAAVTQADRKLLDRMQGKSDDSNPYTDPFKLVRFTDSGYWERFNEWLDGLHTATPEVDQQKAGFFRISLWGFLCEVKNIVISWDTMSFHQIVSGSLGINSQGKVGWSDKYTTLQRRYDGSAWSEWQEDAYETRKTIADDLRTAYTDKGVSLNLYNGDTRLFGDSIAAATQSKAGVMSAEDKVTLDSFDGKIKGEQTAREEGDSALGGRIAALEKKVPNEIRTFYSNDGVSIDLYHDDTSLWSDTIEPATEERAGVMSAEDKIEQRNIRTFIETFKKNLIPSGLTVSCLERITLGNVEPIYITAELTPDTAYRNIIYISDNKAVTVGTDGRVTPVSVGKSVVSVIPTCNTSLAKTIIVEVGRPFTRLVNNRSTLRFTSSGTFRLT